MRWLVVAVAALSACSAESKDGALAADDGAAGDGSDGAGDGAGDGGGDGGGDGEHPDPRWAAVAAAAAADMAASGAYAISVAVLDDGELVYSAAVGARDGGGGGAVTTDTLFAIGSTTKNMAAALAMREVEAGRLALDAPLSLTLPELDPANAPLLANTSLRQLLMHSSGISDWLDWRGGSGDADLAAATYGAFSDEVYQMAAPGDIWNYSNPNYALAGLMTEQVDPAGRPWADIVSADIFAPLGLDRCVARGVDVVADGDFTVGAGVGLSGLPRDVGPTDFDPSFARPAGLVWCTPEAMVRWGWALLGGHPEVVSEVVRAEMIRPQIDLGYSEPGAQTYGFGLFIDQGFALSETEWSDALRIDHGGNTLGHTSAFTLIPDEGVVVSVLASAYGADLSATTRAALDAVDALGPLRSPPPVAPDPSQWPDFVGTYVDAFNVGTMHVSEEDGGLVVDCPLLDAYDVPYDRRLVAWGPRTFLWEVQGTTLDLSFLRPVGVDAGPTMYVRNRIFVATRDDSSARMAPLRGAPDFSMAEPWRGEPWSPRPPGPVPVR